MIGEVNIPNRKQLVNFLKLLIKHYNMGDISDAAIVLAYYGLLSMFPMMIIIGNIIKILNANTNHLLMYIKPFFPTSVYNILLPIINAAMDGASKGNLSLGLIVTIWSASKALAAFQRSINKIYGVAHSQNILMNRFFSFIWLILLIITIFFLVLFISFSQIIMKFMIMFFNLSSELLYIFSIVRWPLTLIMIFLLIMCLYYFVPNVKTKWRYVILGSIVATIGLIVLGQFFSLYIRYFGKNLNTYKALGTFILLMFWLDFVGVVLLFGAVINVSFQELKNYPIIKSSTSFNKFFKKTKKMHNHNK